MRAERGMLILRRDDDTLDTRVARASGDAACRSTACVSETLVRKSFAAGKPSVIADVNKDADLAVAESVVSLELRSAVTLPLVRFVARGKARRRRRTGVRPDLPRQPAHARQLRRLRHGHPRPPRRTMRRR